MPEFLLNLLFSALATLFICAAGFLLGRGVWRVAQVKADRQHTVRLDNQGNCRNVYYLTVDSPEPALKFSLFFNNQPLAEVSSPDAGDEDVEPAPTPTARQGTVDKVSGGADAAAKSGRTVASGAGMLASFLGAIGSLLPGSAGSALKEQAAQSREVQANALKVARGPQTMRMQAGRFGKAVPRGSGSRPVGAATRNQGGGLNAYVAQSPEIDPGQSISLILRIGALKKRYPQGSFPYTVQVQPVAVDFPQTQAEAISRGGMAHFGQVAGWRYFLPVFTSAVMALLTMIALVYVYSYIWQG